MGRTRRCFIQYRSNIEIIRIQFLSFLRNMASIRAPVDDRFKAFFPGYANVLLNDIPPPDLPSGDENCKVWYCALNCGEITGRTRPEVIEYLSGPEFYKIGNHLTKLKRPMLYARNWWCKYYCTKNIPSLKTIISLYDMCPKNLELPPVKIHSIVQADIYLKFPHYSNDEYPPPPAGKKNLFINIPASVILYEGRVGWERVKQEISHIRKSYGYASL